MTAIVDRLPIIGDDIRDRILNGPRTPEAHRAMLADTPAMNALEIGGQGGVDRLPEEFISSQRCFYPPTLITGLSPADPLMQEEVFGPVLVGTTFRTPTEAVELANCPFHALAREHTALVCRMNLHLITAMLAELGRPDVRAGLDPAPGRCCVSLSADPG